MFSTAFPLWIKSALGLVYSFFFAVCSSLGVNVTYTTTMPVAEEDFVPAIRFVVCTDSHQDYQNAALMINTCYDIYGTGGIDLFVHCGDFTEIGLRHEFERFRDAFMGAIEGRSEAMIIMGNHDLKSMDNPHQEFCDVFGVSDSKQHITVNGFHFIGLPSYTESAVQLAPLSAISWAKEELSKAEQDSGNLPVFTFQHPHNFGTVYGSTIWGSLAYNSVWNGHNRVVNFSGHSHFPIEDPRSIWQGSYTALGAGGLSKFELEKDLIWGQHPEGYDDGAEFLVVEADLDGSVKIDAYDLNIGSFFLSYYIENVNDTSTYAYTYKNRLAYDEAPTFGEDAQATITIDDSSDAILTFDRAYDKLIVHDYKVLVLNKNNIAIKRESYLSDYYLEGRGERMTINLGKVNLKKGEAATVQIIATNAYYEVSEPILIHTTVK